ncbi:dirigent protein 1-like [Silene latifolia]|uniref:dirigent protein 1-like n=1 Tax=Silene latifolia TaxID=37657 RepID=UPI003D77C4FE
MYYYTNNIRSNKTMAKSSLLYLILLTFLPTLAISSSHYHKHGYKSMHFTLYQHDIYNKTDLLIVPGVAGANFSDTAAPFGTITVLNDNLTLTQDPSSKLVGNAEAMTVISSFDGLDSLSIVRFTLKLEGGRHMGTISAVGVVNNLNPSQVPVTGGTGDFLLVQGYFTSSFVSSKALTYIYKLDFNLFWPPYAPHALKG